LVADEAVAARIYERLFRNKELVCLRIIWIGGGAHFTTIRGCTDPSVGGPFIVSTSDTLEGFSGSTLSYDDFPLKYHIGGVGQTRKNSARAYVFRFALELEHCSMQSACIKRAKGHLADAAAHSAKWTLPILVFHGDRPGPTPGLPT
jgi:hypothetical protein